MDGFFSIFKCIIKVWIVATNFIKKMMMMMMNISIMIKLLSFFVAFFLFRWPIYIYTSNRTKRKEKVFHFYSFFFLFLSLDQDDDDDDVLFFSSSICYLVDCLCLKSTRKTKNTCSNRSSFLNQIKSFFSIIQRNVNIIIIIMNRNGKVKEKQQHQAKDNDEWKRKNNWSSSTMFFLFEMWMHQKKNKDTNEIWQKKIDAIH